jgi:ribosomal protein L11 methyltransferase
VFSLFLRCTDAEKDLLIERVWELETSGVVERDIGDGLELQAFFDERFDAAEFSAHDPRWQEEAPTDWVQVFEDSWQPFPVGRRFYLVPEWRNEPTPDGRLRLTIHPGRACGTGWHPATQLSLLALEDYLKPGDTMLDLGTGSGILAEAALLLGARFVAACDIDAEAVAVARENLRRLGVGLYLGSIRSVASGSIDLVMANINAETIAMLMPEIARIARDRVILTGFPERDLARVRRSLLGSFREFAALEQDGWMCLAAAR